jgi:long-chain acyl-CoA synthetase
MNLIQEIQTLAGLPRILSRDRGSSVALIIENRKINYQELDELSNRVANALIEAGVVSGDRIALLARDSVASVTMLFGVAKAKAILVNINWRLAADEIANTLRDATPRLLFVDEEFMRLIPEINARMDPAPQYISLSDWGKDAAGTAPNLSYDADDVVVQIYTSGTTGHPKGVRLKNRSFFALAHEMDAVGDRWIGWTESTMSLLFVPTFHIGGLWWLVRGLALGSATLLLRSFDPRAILRVIPQYRVTKTCMVPSMVQVLLSEPGCSTTDFSSLETIVYGGSPISPALLERAIKVFQCDFFQIYGMTETGNMAVCLRPEDHNLSNPKRLRAAGRPLPGVKARIIDSSGDVLGPGAMGEIALESPARMEGYWNRPEATQATLVDGWVMTGDAGYQDEEGFVFVCDRIKEMIICAGENIYPAEIENVLRAHPGVADAAVIGIPDDLWGEAVKAVIVPEREHVLASADIIRFARNHLAEFKIPKLVDFVEQLPRNATGKILKSRMREPYWQGRDRGVN